MRRTLIKTVRMRRDTSAGIGWKRKLGNAMRCLMRILESSDYIEVIQIYLEMKQIINKYPELFDFTYEEIKENDLDEMI